MVIKFRFLSILTFSMFFCLIIFSELLKLSILIMTIIGVRIRVKIIRLVCIVLV